MCVRRSVSNITSAIQRIVASCVVAVSDVGGNSPIMLGPAEGCAQIMDMVSMSNLFLDGYRYIATASQREGRPGRPKEDGQGGV